MYFLFRSRLKKADTMKNMGPPSMYGRLANHPCYRSALYYSCPPKMLLEISKLRKKNGKWICVGNYVIFLYGQIHFKSDSPRVAMSPIILK